MTAQQRHLKNAARFVRKAARKGHTRTAYVAGGWGVVVEEGGPVVWQAHGQHPQRWRRVYWTLYNTAHCGQASPWFRRDQVALLREVRQEGGVMPRVFAALQYVAPEYRSGPCAVCRDPHVGEWRDSLNRCNDCSAARAGGAE